MISHYYIYLKKQKINYIYMNLFIQLVLFLGMVGGVVCLNNLVLEHPLMVRWVVGSIPHGSHRAIAVTASVPELVWQEGRKEGSVLFNDALNSFCLRLYGVRHMVKEHSDRKRGNPLPPHRLLFPNMHHPTDRKTYTTPIMEHGLEREIAQWVHHEGSIRRPIAPTANTLTTELHLAPSVAKALVCVILSAVWYI